MFRITMVSIAFLALTCTLASAQEKEQPRGKKVTGAVTKVDTASITVTRRGDSGVTEDTLKIVASTKVVMETAEDQILKGEGGRERKEPKTKDAKTSDLKTGQRVVVAASANNEAMTIRVLREPKARPKEGDR